MTREMPIKAGLKSALSDICEGGGKPYIIGGAVRDWLLGEDPKDIDLEVYGVDPSRLERILGAGGEVDLVGRSFGVYKIRRGGEEFDVSLPRKDSKAGSGHTGFDILVDPSLSPTEASRRRDFTINSMFYDPVSTNLFDPHQGLADLKAKVLRHTSEAFSEDPLRVLRGVQFSARFDFDLHRDTAELCRSMQSSEGLDKLPRERIFEEIKKFILKGRHHVKGFSTWEKTGWLKFFPELENLRGTEQDPHWHPEGDVLTHTGFALQALHKIPRFQEVDASDRLAIGLGVLCHDMGKPLTSGKTWHEKLGREIVTSHNHQIAGVDVCRGFLSRLGVGERVIRRVEGLVRFHMEHLWVKSRRDVRKLAFNLSSGKEGGGVNIEALAFVTEADHSGRPPLFPGQATEMKKIISIAMQEGCLLGSPEALLSGSDLLELGLAEGKIIGTVLKGVYEAQIGDGFSTKKEAIEWTKSNLRRLGSKDVPPVVTGQHLLDLGVKPGKIYSEILDKSYLVQLSGGKIDSASLLGETGNSNETTGLDQGRLKRGGQTSPIVVSSSHETISRDR